MYDHINSFTVFVENEKSTGTSCKYDVANRLDRLISELRVAINEMYNTHVKKSIFNAGDVLMPSEDVQRMIIFENILRWFGSANESVDGNKIGGLYAFRKIFEIIYTNRKLLTAYTDINYTTSYDSRLSVFILIESINDNVLNLPELFMDIDNKKLW